MQRFAPDFGKSFELSKTTAKVLSIPLSNNNQKKGKESSKSPSETRTSEKKFKIHKGLRISLLLTMVLKTLKRPESIVQGR